MIRQPKRVPKRDLFVNQSIVIFPLLPPPQVHTLIFDLSARRFKQSLARKPSQTTPEAAALPAVDPVGIRAVFYGAEGTDPLPDPANVAVAVGPNRGPHVGVGLDLLPQLRAARSGELVSQDVVAQLRHADEALVPGGEALGVQVGLLVELLQR